MPVLCGECGTRYSKWSLLGYLLNYLEPYMVCFNCKKDLCVEPKNSNKKTLIAKIVGIFIIFILTYFLWAKLLVPPETVSSDRYFVSERGQLYAKVRSPFATFIILSSLSAIVTFFLTIPVHRYANWKAFKSELGE